MFARWFAVGILSILFVLSSACSGLPLAPAKVDQVKFLMDYAPGGSWAYAATAIDKGFYRDENLSVELVRGSGSQVAIQGLDGGKGEFGMVDVSVLVVQRGQGSKVKAVGMYRDIYPLGYLTLDDRGIKTPKDLEGKTLGGNPNLEGTLLLPAFAKGAGIDAAKVKIANMAADVIAPALLDGKIDFMGAFRGSSYIVVKREAAKRNRGLVYFPVRDYGLDTYSTAFGANEDFIKANPDLVRRFLRATYRGMDYAVTNPDEAVDSLARLYPELQATRELIREQWIDTQVVFKKDPQRGWGLMDEQKMQRTRDVFGDLYKVTANIPLPELYTNEFLPGLK